MNTLVYANIYVTRNKENTGWFDAGVMLHPDAVTARKGAHRAYENDPEFSLVAVGVPFVMDEQLARDKANGGFDED